MSNLEPLLVRVRYKSDMDVREVGLGWVGLSLGRGGGWWVGGREGEGAGGGVSGWVGEWVVKPFPPQK